jgi:SAM-dependent methyltransferase
VRYPYLDQVACLMVDPGLWRAQWLGRLREYVFVLDERATALAAEARQPGLLPRTRARVERVAESVLHEAKVMRDFAGVLAASPHPAGPALPTQLLEHDKRALLECDEHVFRDWVWGHEEVERLRLFSERMLPKQIGNLAIYGVGAARLAVDVHRSLRPERTFALDINPLPLWVAARLLRGETVERYELPLWPNRDQDVVVKRSIRYDEPAPADFTLLIADALRAPFAPGSLDVVLTCWFIDAVDADLRQLGACINRVLRPGGLWVNAGPLRFKAATARNYSIEEVHELVTISGFDLEARESEALPYFASPLGGTQALERVFGFAARKRAEVAAVETAPRGPAWLLNPTLPVPTTPALERLQRASAISAGIVSLVDGTRSLLDIAQLLASNWQVDAAQVLPELRAFFSVDEA